MGFDRALLAGLLLSLPSLAGCPTCDEKSGMRSFTFTVPRDPTQGFAFLPNGAFSYDGRTYRDCRDFCDRSDAFFQVESCTPPTRSASYSGYLGLDCVGKFAVCTEFDFGMGSGRFTEGGRRSKRTRSLSDYWEAMFFGEASAVVAFRRLARELLAHGASPNLVSACRDAARDEARHARMVQPRGSRASRVRKTKHTVRPLPEILAENIREGCVGEALGVGVLVHQAMHASPEFRPLFQALMQDEAQHGALSVEIACAHSVHSELRSVMRAALRDGSASARKYPFEDLPQADRVQIGAPSPEVYARLWQACAVHVWQPLAARLAA